MADPNYTEGPACFIGLTENGADPVDTDTALTGEIAAGSLARAQGTFAHTTGTNTYTVTKTFTSDSRVTVLKAGFFTAAAGGVMAFEKLLDDPGVLVVGDLLQTTGTFSL